MHRGRPPWLACTAIALAAAAVSGCGGGGVDTRAAREFEAYPLYWLGTHFETWDLEYVSVGEGEFSSFGYGTCEPTGDDGGCPTPLQIQIQPLCAHLDVVAADPSWERRRIRGAPVGTIDHAPVLFTNRVQIKIYRGQGSDPELPFRAFRALRSANAVEPALASGEPFPRPATAVLTRARPCRGGPS